VTAAVGPHPIRPAERLSGRLRLPSDKSIAHRALLANALSDGTASVVLNRPGIDAWSTINTLRALGVQLEVLDGQPTVVHIRG
jgi:3-phosphoshikimate 1-carboxyvinyltransferase